MPQVTPLTLWERPLGRDAGDRDLAHLAPTLQRGSKCRRSSVALG